MELQEYIKHLQVLEKLNPKAKVVYASDDEGNSFRPVVYNPSPGRMDGQSFVNVGKSIKPEVVCVN